MKRKPESKEAPDGWQAEVKAALARQITALRGGRSQAAFGKLIGKPQSVVSRLEDPNYGKVTLQTLLDIATKLDVALLVRFTSHDSQPMQKRLPVATSPRKPRP